LREGGIAQDDGSISPVYENLQAHKPMIDTRLFECVQAVLAQNVRV
jgi:hypothetical protein